MGRAVGGGLVGGRHVVGGTYVGVELLHDAEAEVVLAGGAEAAPVGGLENGDALEQGGQADAHALVHLRRGQRLLEAVAQLLDDARGEGPG